MAKHPPCTYCGDAPVPHPVLFIDSTVNIFTRMLLPKRLSRSSFFDPARSPLLRAGGKLLLRIGSVLTIVRIHHAPYEKTSKRTRAIWEEGLTRGIQVQSFSAFGKDLEECRARLKCGRWMYFQSIPWPRSVPQTTGTWVDDKGEFKRRFAGNGLRVAQGAWAVRERTARSIFQSIGKPVIVKPREGSRARHTSVNVTREDEVVEAFRRAQQICLFVMVEEYVPGDTYRATCVGGKLVAVMKYEKAVVVADGVRTCEELRAAYNEALPYRDVSPVADDAWFRDALLHQGYSRTSVPSKGTRLLLAEHSERANGGYNRDVTDLIPHAHRVEIERAAALTELPVVGFDLISEDLTLEDLPFTFIEANTLPFIYIHHEPSVGTPRNVAGAIWDLWALEEKSQQEGSPEEGDK
jgi:cyanophycin synthetase